MRNNLHNSSLAIIAATLLNFGSACGAHAADPFTDGTKYFKNKQYALASKSFERAIEANPRNHVAYYYHALALHYSKDSVAARREYARIIQNFPMSDAANYSRKALAVMDPALLKSISPDYVPSGAPQQVRSNSNTQSYSRQPQSTQGSYASSNDRLPDEARIPFTRDGGGIMIDGMFNNRPMKVLYDTGSEATIFGKNHLQSMGIPEPSGAATGTSSSAGTATKTWNMRMNIKIGSVERNDFPVVIKESMLDSPSVSKSFFKEYACNVDNNARCLVLAKQGTRAAASAASSFSSSRSNSDPYAIPFIKDDNDLMIVSVSVDGRPVQMAVDTGASSIMMTKEMAKRFGIAVPEDAEETVVNGTSGQTRGKKVQLRVVKMGAIEKRNVSATVVDNFSGTVPLLGQSFFGDSSYTIDDSAKLIRFRR